MNQANYSWNEIKKIRNKRTGKLRYIVGSVVSAIGVMQIMDFVQYPYSWHLHSLIEGGIMLLVGAAVLVYTWRRIDKWNRYEAYINNRGNTSIAYLARSLGESEPEVRSTLQQMINNHFFLGPESNVEAYIDGPRNLLVMTQNGKPLEPIEETMRRMEATQAKNEDRAGAAQAAGEAGAGTRAQSSASAQTKAASRQPSSYTMQLRAAIESTEDKEVKASLYDLEGSVRRIEQRLAKDPALAESTNIKNLQRHYLPMTMDLVRKYQEEKNSPETMERIGEALGICADAFSNIEAKLTEKDDLSTEVDIQTLENMFAQDGLLQVAGRR